MDWEALQVDLAGIDAEDRTYRISTDASIEPLAAAIGTTGLLNPPFLYPNNNRQFTVVAGFRRIAACRHLEMQRIRARLIKPSTPGHRLVAIAIGDNAFQRSLNLVEVSRSLGLLRRHVQDPGEMERIARNLGLPANPAMAEKIAGICRMPASIQDGIVQGVIPLNTAIELSRLEKDAAFILSNLFRELRLSHSKQREVATNVREVAFREGSRPADILREPQLQALMDDPQLDRVQKSNQIRAYVKSRRYPQLTLSEKRFHEDAQKLLLGEYIKLKPPANFESREYNFNLRIKNVTELATCVKTLQNTLANPALKRILERD